MKVSDSFKSFYLAKTVLFVLAYLLLIYFSIKITVMSFQYIDILNARYDVSVSKVKIVFASFFFPLVLGFAIGIYLEVMWVWRLYSDEDCT